MAEDQDLTDPERRFGHSFFGKSERDITEGRDFIEQSRLADALRAAKPEFLKDGHGLQGPPRPERANINDVRRTDAGNGSVQRQPKRAAFPPDASVEQIESSGASRITPFFVTKSTLAGVTKLKVYPGRISTIVPTIGGIKLDNNPAPTLTIVTGAPFSLFLRASITVDTDNLFRSFISAVKVCTDNDPDVVPDIDGGTGEIIELKVTWENSPTNTIGHFYLKIADINVSGATVTIATQWLFDSYTTFTAAGNEIQVMV